MPSSAYKDGQLKKNPLLGTTLNLPGRRETRERFLGLYGEAKQHAGKGREHMKGQLAGRHRIRAASEESALGGLQSQYGALQNKADSLRSDAAKKKFFSDLGDMSEIDRQEAYEKDVEAKVRALSDEGKVLAAEYDRRSHSLQQHINDYNLFLGSY